MEENFFMCPVVFPGVDCCRDGKSSFHIIFIFSSNDQQACIHLPYQYAPHPTKLAASVYSNIEVELDHSVSTIQCRRCHSMMEGKSATVLYQDEHVNSI